MKYTIPTICFLLIALTIQSCGPDEEEQQQREQARQDSLEEVRQQQVEQQRQDSLAKVKAENDSLATDQRTRYEFSNDGSFAIQVESWRSRVKAQTRAEEWKARGFENANVVQYGREETGNIWFRVRLGQVQTRQAARELQEQLQEEYQTKSWIVTL